MITTQQLIAKYGKPTQDGKAYLVSIALPFPMRLAWDKKNKRDKTKMPQINSSKTIKRTS